MGVVMGKSDEVQLSAAHKAARLRLLRKRMEETYGALMARQAEKDMQRWKTHNKGLRTWPKK
jgi:hypothetical protein